jgi:hypothetical protein
LARPLGLAVNRPLFVQECLDSDAGVGVMQIAYEMITLHIEMAWQGARRGFID